jgi:hypothetical protein
VLLGIDAASAHSGGLPRAPWVMRVLVEHLRDGLDGSRKKSFGGIAETGRGVTDQRVQPLVWNLVESGYIVPVGIKAEALWTVAPEHVESVTTMWSALSTNEAQIVRRAAQRAAAIFVALSNTCLASGESSDETTSSGSTRRHVVR